MISTPSIPRWSDSVLPRRSFSSNQKPTGVFGRRLTSNAILLLVPSGASGLASFAKIPTRPSGCLLWRAGRACHLVCSESTSLGDGHATSMIVGLERPQFFLGCLSQRPRLVGYHLPRRRSHRRWTCCWLLLLAMASRAQLVECDDGGHYARLGTAYEDDLDYSVPTLAHCVGHLADERRPEFTRVGFVQQLTQLAAVLAIAVLVLNIGYGFDGAFEKLRKPIFVSRPFAGGAALAEGGVGGNRFAGTWVGELPIPFPRNYLRGMDLQKYDFERGLPSYLCGEWKDRGWWYYYLVCAALKVPLGIWGLGLTAFGVSLQSSAIRKKSAHPSDSVDGWKRFFYSWRDEIILLLPAVGLFVFVSSQAGFGRHFRYVLPAFPFVFIWMSKVSTPAIRCRTLGVLVAALLTWTVASSLWIYPHSMSYFNELVGGPRHGHRYLLGSNLDCGQDVFYLKRWRKEHREASPLSTLFSNSYALDLMEMRDLHKKGHPGVFAPTGGVMPAEETWARVPFPGWYATSIRRIHDADGDYLYFLKLRPVAMAGYGFRIYHIALDDANRLRTEMGEPLLPSDWCTGDTFSPPTEERAISSRRSLDLREPEELARIRSELRSFMWMTSKTRRPFLSSDCLTTQRSANPCTCHQKM